jgi:hypothetical protein
LLIAIGGLFVLNLIYQVARKPVEVFAPIGSALLKTPEATWRSYGRLFQSHSTDTIPPELLAALAQVEASGNPLARPEWRWKWSWNPLEIYRPASSAAGLFQITDGTFAEASKYCIRDHQVATEGRWSDLDSCWFNRLYTRTVPSHAIEMTAAHLHRNVFNTLSAFPRLRATATQKQNLAAVIHLCGPARGKVFAAGGFRVARGERCGTHDLHGYLRKVALVKTHFVRLRAATQS